MAHPAGNMLKDGDIKNIDIFYLQTTCKDIVLDVQRDIHGIQNSMQQLLKNNSNSRPGSIIQGASIPDEVEQFSLPPAKREDIESMMQSDNKLGSGQFGDVYIGQYKGQVVALKVLTQKSHKANVELIHELKIMHCYPAENILPLFSYCLDPPCLVFQYMENGTLFSKLLDSRNPLNWKQRANVAVGIARGLRHLHSYNIVHGDIKGLNILLDRHLEPKIGDFGSTRLLYNKSGQTTSVVFMKSMPGTPYYLPNWYLAIGQQGKEVRKTIDVYSFGMVLLEILSGKLSECRDSQERTLRIFVDTDIANHFDPPEDYIAPVDTKDRKFQINIKNRVDGKLQVSVVDADWARIMFDAGRSCTIFDQTPWEPPLRDPTPWKTMKEKDITMERIHELLEECYHYYREHLGENAKHQIKPLEITDLVKKVTTGILPNEPQKMDC